jgi:hypothetical protein
VQNALSDVKSKRTAFPVHIAPMGRRSADKDEERPGPAIRLALAREKRGYKTALAAARAFGWNENTYPQYERGVRGLSQVATQFASTLRVSVGWLMNGEGPDPFASSVPLLGFTFPDTDSIHFGDDSLDNVEAPKKGTEHTVAIEIRGDALGAIFDGWVVFYDDVRKPPEPEILGSLCVLGLADDRVVIKHVEHGQLPDRFTLKSNTRPPVYDAEIKWAAPVIDMRPKARQISRKMVRWETKVEEPSDA